MKTAIFYEKTERKTSESLVNIIDSHQCALFSCEVTTVLDAKVCADPSTLLQDVTHMVFVFAENTLTCAPVFLFLLGIGIGKKLPLLIVQQGNKLQLPDNCKRFAVILTADKFENYFVAEQNRFFEIEQKQGARSKLMSNGFPCFESNFIAAVEEGKCDIVQLFLDAGFNSSLRDKRGTPLLSLAVRNSHYDVALLLISHGAGINLCAEDRSYSALMDAAQLGDLKTAELLLSKNADTNIRSKDGQTALIFAVGRQDIPMVKLLIEHHADCTIADNLGMSALGYAKLFNNKNILACMQAP